MKILVGYDGSNQAKEALALAKKHALAFNANVYVVTSMIGEDQTTPEEIRQAKAGLEFAEQFLKEGGISVETHLLIRGLLPGDDLVQFATEKQVDEIVIGVRKASSVGKLILPWPRSSRPRAVARTSDSTSESPNGRPCAARKVLAIPPPISNRSARARRLSTTAILSEIFAPPRIATKGCSGDSMTFPR